MLWLTVGFSLPFEDGPPPDREAPNSQSCFGISEFGDRSSFVSEAVSALVANGAVVKTDREFLKVVSPLNVVEQRDKLRLIHNLAYVNSYLTPFKFRYEGRVDIPQLCLRNDFLISIDLQSAYHHLPMAESAWPYLGFQWEGEYYYFRVLPFGLAPAP